MDNVESILGAALGIGMFAILALFFIFCMAIVVYSIWQILLLQKTLRYFGHPKPWYMWIPFLNIYTLASLCGRPGQKVKILGFDLDYEIFKFGWIAPFIVNFIPIIGQVAFFVLTVIYYGKVYSYILAVLENRSEDSMGAKGYIAVLVPFALPIFLTRDFKRLGFK